MTQVTEKDYSNYVRELSQSYPNLAGKIAGWHSVESVLDWIQARKFPPGSVDLVGQDEFESDFLVEIEPGNRWLAFGIT